MAEILLTKDANKLFCTIYKIYLERLKNGIDKNSAIFFRQTDVSNINISNELLELNNSNLIKLYIDNSFMLKPLGIIYMENRFKNGLIEVTDFIAKFIP